MLKDQLILQRLSVLGTRMGTHVYFDAKLRTIVNLELVQMWIRVITNGTTCTDDLRVLIMQRANRAWQYLEQVDVHI